MEFEQRTESLTQKLQSDFDSHLDVLRSMQNFFASSPSVSKDSIHSFVAGGIADHPGIQSLSTPGELVLEHSAPANGSTDLEDIERVTIERVFEQVNGDKTLAGQLLGISRATLYRKLKRYGIGIKASTATASTAEPATPPRNIVH